MAGVRRRPPASCAPARIAARIRRPPILLVSAAGIALAGLLLEALFRSARLQSLQAYDAWAFWVPKAKAIYFFGGLDEHVFTTSPGSTYPPLEPILDAAAFHAMGGADTVTLHVQFWFLVAGGVGAIAGLLHRHAPAWLLWPSLLLVLVVPRFGERLLAPQADVLVDVLFVVAALLLALWLRDWRGWRLAAAPVLLAGADLTKREGILFAAVVLVAAFVASSRAPAWPVLGSSARGRSRCVPWRIWAERTRSQGRCPRLRDRPVRPALARSLSFNVLYPTRLWSVLPFVPTIALGVGAIWGDRRLAAFFAAPRPLLFAGGVWSRLGFPELADQRERGTNPIVRYTGAIVVLARGVAPLLVASAWRRREASPDASHPRRGRRDRRRPADRLPARRRGRRRPFPLAR